MYVSSCLSDLNVTQSVANLIANSTILYYLKRQETNQSFLLQKSIKIIIKSAFRCEIIIFYFIIIDGVFYDCMDLYEAGSRETKVCYKNNKDNSV